MSNIDKIGHEAYIRTTQEQNMNISLSPKFEAYIQQQLEDGAYNNASEVIREALRLKMQQDEIYRTKLEALRAAIIQGENSGAATAFDIHEILQDIKKETKQDV